MPSRPQRSVLALAALLLLTGCTGADPADPAAGPDHQRSGTARAGGSPEMTVPRAVHKATVLHDGRVLFTGGCTLAGCGGFEQGQTSEVFDPASRRFVTGPAMTTPRAGHTATLLGDGRVLLVGGYPGEGRPALATAEVFDPATNTFRPVADLSEQRADHTATVMPDGRVLIAGGTTGTGGALSSTEVFDPATNRFGAGSSLTTARSGHVAVSTAGRLVLIGGTSDLESAMATTDVLDHGVWSPGPRLRQARTKHAAVVLPDRTVLVIGGAPSPEGRERLASTELLSLGSNRTRPGPALSEGQYKLEGAVTSLVDGRVVIAGGRQVDVYDPGTGKMSVLPGAAVPRRSFISASTVAASTVLVAGGYDTAIAPTASARLIDIS